MYEYHFPIGEIAIYEGSNQGHYPRGRLGAHVARSHSSNYASEGTYELHFNRPTKRNNLVTRGRLEDVSPSSMIKSPVEEGRLLTD